MPAIPPLGALAPREEWNDADFDFLDGDPIHASDAESEKGEDVGEDEDWDIEMDLGKTGGATVRAAVGDVAESTTVNTGSSNAGDDSRLFTIRPPLTSIDDEDEDDGVPTIKAADLLKVAAAGAPEAPFDEDFEDGFALPSDLTQLSLRPLELNHRSSKSSLEWGDKDHTVSSQSSDAYSMLGFADHSPPSTVYTSTSLPDTETEDEEEEVEDLLDGLVVPSGLFESGQSAKKLTKILETKKKAIVTDMRVKIASPDPEDDFESGLVFDNDMELSPSRLLQAAQQTVKVGSGATTLRSKSVPRASTLGRPQSRSKSDRARSPNVPPISSSQQLRKLARPSSPPKPSSSSRNQTYSQAVASASTLSTKSSFLAPKYSSLRGQKSHTVLKAPSPSHSRGLSRKASLPSLSDHSSAQASSSRQPEMPVPARYNAPTASSKAKSHTNSTGRLHTFDYNVPPTRPSTPSSNPVALRLTMPTSSSRLKTRPPISNVFLPSPVVTTAPPRTTSPLPAPPRPPSASSSRPPSSKSRHAQTQSLPVVPAAKVLKRPKRTRTYGDGTELDSIEDLPLDREKEGKYRVQPKGSGTRIPGASYASVVAPSLSRKPPDPEMAGGKTLKRTSRIEFLAGKPSESAPITKRKNVSSPQARRKPTLIRNLGGSGGPKVVGEMKWNPNTLRWEGNDQVLRDFDAAVGTSTRPALITHLTGSSIGSPVNCFAAGARKVGNMIFDPAKMCWISTLPPEEDEPDVFANLADDEDDEDSDANTRTIRANQQCSVSSGSHHSQADTTPGSAVSRTRSRSESESDRCSRASMVCDIEEGFFEKCRAAEVRHRSEMRGWTTTSTTDRSFLYEIRALATRQY